MQLTPEQKQVFEQLAMRPEFVALVKQEQQRHLTVLKANLVDAHLLRAQGAVTVWDEIEAAMKRK